MINSQHVVISQGTTTSTTSTSSIQTAVGTKSNESREVTKKAYAFSIEVGGRNTPASVITALVEFFKKGKDQAMYTLLPPTAPHSHKKL
jgi:hypothetical protein